MPYGTLHLASSRPQAIGAALAAWLGDTPLLLQEDSPTEQLLGCFHAAFAPGIDRSQAHYVLTCARGQGGEPYVDAVYLLLPGGGRRPVCTYPPQP